MSGFMAKVWPMPDGCWLWCGTVMSNGYGSYAQTTAHRWAYTQIVGPIPEGCDLDHLCRVRACVNPAHLEPVTRSENLRRGWAARPKQETCKQGHALIEENLTPPSGPRGQRQCRTCAAAAKRRYKLRRRMATVTKPSTTQPERTPA